MPSVALAIPMAPMPKKRPRFGAGAVYNDDKYSQWKRDFGLYCLGAVRTEGPFKVTILFYTRNGKMRPDIDNAAGAVLDALQEAGVIENDRHARELHAALRIGTPQIQVVIEPFPEVNR